MEDSKIIVEVNTVECSVCKKEFYEFNDKELAECPYCGTGFIQEKANVNLTARVVIEVDHQTGTIREA